MCGVAAEGCFLTTWIGGVPALARTSGLSAKIGFVLFRLKKFRADHISHFWRFLLILPLAKSASGFA
jgi:hypothetical protein